MSENEFWNSFEGSALAGILGLSIPDFKTNTPTGIYRSPSAKFELRRIDEPTMQFLQVRFGELFTGGELRQNAKYIVSFPNPGDWLPNANDAQKNSFWALLGRFLASDANYCILVINPIYRDWTNRRLLSDFSIEEISLGEFDKMLNEKVRVGMNTAYESDSFLDLMVKIHDEQGKPVPGCMVWATDGFNEEKLAVTDALGKTQLAEIASVGEIEILGQSWIVMVAHQSYPSVEDEISLKVPPTYHATLFKREGVGSLLVDANVENNYTIPGLEGTFRIGTYSGNRNLLVTPIPDINGESVTIDGGYAPRSIQSNEPIVLEDNTGAVVEVVAPNVRGPMTRLDYTLIVPQKTSGSKDTNNQPTGKKTSSGQVVERNDAESIESSLRYLAAELLKTPTDTEFAVGDDGRIQLAGPSNLESIPATNEVFNELKAAASDLSDALLGNNAYPALSKKVESYKEAVSGKNISIECLYARGVRLATVADATYKSIEARDLPPPSLEVKHNLDSVLVLHHAFMMTSEKGKYLVDTSANYRQSPQQTDRLKAAAVKLAKSIGQCQNLFGENVREQFTETAQDIGVGPDPEKSSQVATGETKYLALQITSIAATLVSPQIPGLISIASESVTVAMGMERAHEAMLFLSVNSSLLLELAAFTQSDLSWMRSLLSLVERIKKFINSRA